MPESGVIERCTAAHIPEYIGLGGAGMFLGNTALTAIANPNNKRWLGAIGDGVWKGGIKVTLFEAMCMVPTGLLAVWATGAEAQASETPVPTTTSEPPVPRTEAYV